MAYRKPLDWSLKPPDGALIDWGHPLSQGLVSAWALSEGAGFRPRDSARCKAGSAGAGCSWAPGQRGVALSFIGNYSGQVTGDAGIASFASTQSHTFVAWIRAGSGPASGGLIGGGSGTLGSVLRVASGTSLIFGYGSSTYTASGSYSAGQWYQVAAVYSAGTNTVTLYLNGIAKGTSGALGSWSATTTAVLLGGISAGSSAGAFAGQIDQARVYNRALSQAEIWELFAAPWAGYARARLPIAMAVVPPATASLSATLAGVGLAATAHAAAVASLSATLAGVGLSSAAVHHSTAALSASLAGVTLSSTATAHTHAALSSTLAGVALASASTAHTHASLSSTLTGVSLASTAHTKATAALSSTLGGVALSSTVTASNSAHLTATLAGVSLSATGHVKATVSFSATLAGVNLSATGGVSAFAHLSVTLAGLTLSSEVQHAATKVKVRPARWSAQRWGAPINEGGFIWTGLGSALPSSLPGLVLPAQPIRPAVRIVFRDRSRNVVGVQDTNAESCLLTGGSFELLDTGCGSFELDFADPLPFVVDQSYTVEIYLYNQPVLVYSGFVQIMTGSTTNYARKLSGFGFTSQLNQILLQGLFSQVPPSEIASYLVQTLVAPNSQIVFDAGQVVTNAYNTPGTTTSSGQVYNVQYIKFIYDDPTVIWPQLALLAGGYQYGVDEHRRFFFKPLDNTTYEYLNWGFDFESANDEPDASQLCNSYVIQLGQIRNDLAQSDFFWNTNFVKEPLQDTDSIEEYGLAQQIFNSPTTLSAIDATRMASILLAENSTPTHRAQVQGIIYRGVPITGRGNMQIQVPPMLNGSGTDLLVLPKMRLTYKISGTCVTVDAELGARKEQPSDWWANNYQAQALDAMQTQITQGQLVLASSGIQPGLSGVQPGTTDTNGTNYPPGTFAPVSDPEY